MAAESMGLAASVTGLMSLGLQITGGIIKYTLSIANANYEVENFLFGIFVVNVLLTC